MLNEREIELVKAYSGEKDIDYEKAKEAYLKLKETFIELWDFVKEKIDEIYESIYNTHINKKHDYNWHVPINIEPPPMPDIIMPKMNLARSNL